MKIRLALFFVFLLTMPMTWWACGKKGPPTLVKEKMDLRVQLLKVEKEAAGFRLDGLVFGAKEGENAFEHISGCVVFYGVYPLEDPPCEGCPINFPHVKEIRDVVDTKGVFSCQLQADGKPGIYFFKVRLVSSKGAIGPFSNQMKLTVSDNGSH